MEMEEGECTESSDSEYCSLGDIADEIEMEEGECRVSSDSEACSLSDISEVIEDAEVEVLSDTFTPRSYQLELFECAKEKNSILVLGTGSGKTFISILLMKELAESIRGSYTEGAMRTVFIVNTVPLVYQQAAAISQHTPFTVGHYEGSLGVDIWSENQWKEQIEKHEILVMVAQIFYDMLLHNRLSLDRVNLLVMDECHHATGSHPMREIMREYNKFKSLNLSVPRVLGLTACVSSKRCNMSDIEKHMNNLEETMDSVLVSSKDPETVKLFSTCASEMIIQCSRKETAVDIIESHLNIIKTEVFEKMDLVEEKRDLKKIQKVVSKWLKSILDVVQELGTYIFPKAILLQANYLSEAIAESELETVAINALSEALTDLHRACHRQFEIPSEENLTGKMLRLLEILGKDSCQGKTILIFIIKRNTAKLLCSLINDLKHFDHKLSHWIAESVVGGNFVHKQDLRVSREQTRKQKETLDMFRSGKCNIICSTSVLEEGIDVKKCNLVIRFDPPNNYRAYIQSLGRARAKPSYYVVLEYADSDEPFLNYIRLYEKIHHLLLSRCHGRIIPSLEDCSRNFDDDYDPSYTPYGYPGPQISFLSSVNLLNRYCGSLPQDKFTILTVETKDRNVYVEGVLKTVVDISLPINSPFKGTVSGLAKKNHEDAKKSAALKMGIKLHEAGLLNESLLPVKSKVYAQDIAQKYLVIESCENDAITTGTKKRRQIYERKTCSQFQRTSYGRHLHKINFIHTKKLSKGLNFDTNETSSHIGLLCSSTLRCCDFNLYSKKWGETQISIEYLSYFECDDTTRTMIENFSKKTFEFLLDLKEGDMIYCPKDIDHCLFVVALTDQNTLDYTAMTNMAQFDFELQAEKRKKDCNLGLNFAFNEDKYKNAAVLPCYRKRDLYLVKDINREETPLSPFPDEKKLYSSYMDHMDLQYNISVNNETQSLLECKHFSKEFNYLIPIKFQDKLSESRHPNFIPETCIIFPLSATMWQQMLCLPSILYRINGLQLEKELYEEINYCKRNTGLLSSSALNYFWPQYEINALFGHQNNETHNLSCFLRKKSTLSVYPGMILQALTPLSTHKVFNLERLEILGDAYLKFIVSCFLFCKDVNFHEGLLTLQKGYIVSNKVFYLLAKEKRLGSLIQAVLLSPSNAVPYGFVSNQNLEIALKKTKQSPEFENDGNEEHDPRTQQLVSDKCVADCVEALIGVYLLCGGERAAKHFMHWLGIAFIKEEIRFPLDGLIRHESISRNTAPIIKRLYKKGCLDRLEKILDYQFKEKSFIVQAVTHPSYLNNRATDCYQRLEFLGDAVLDYLVSCYIFVAFSNYDPGQLTDIRSYLVKNETLAKICVRFGLHKYLFHMSPKLKLTVDKFIDMLEQGSEEFSCESDCYEAEDVDVPKALGDIVEALIGAVYIDSGESLEVTWKLVNKFLKEDIENTKTEIPIDCVRALHEKVPGVKLRTIPPTEDELAQCIVQMGGYPNLTGKGKNVRTARQAAAKLALSHISRRSKESAPENNHEEMDD